MPLAPPDPSRSSAGSLKHPEAMADAHHHGHIELNFLEAGRFVLLRQGELVTVEAGTLVMFWAAMPHRVVRLEGARQFHYLHLTLAEFRRWPLPSALTGPVLGGELLASTREPELNRRLVRQWVEDLTTDEEERKALARDEIQARLRRIALNDGWTASSGAGRKKRPANAKRAASGQHALDKVERMSAYLTRHSTGPVRLADLAKSAGLHPAYAGALFKRVTGNSPMEMLTQQRLAHAQRLLITGDATVLTVALECGFSTPSRFYEAFSRTYGVSPGAYRKRMLAAGGFST